MAQWYRLSLRFLHAQILCVDEGSNIFPLDMSACANKRHVRIQKVLSEGVQIWQHFFSWWGEVGSKYHYKRGIIGQPAAFRWRADDGPTLNAGLIALSFFMGSGLVLLRNPIFLWPPPPSGSPHVNYGKRPNCRNDCKAQIQLKLKSASVKCIFLKADQIVVVTLLNTWTCITYTRCDDLAKIGC